LRWGRDENPTRVTDVEDKKLKDKSICGYRGITGVNNSPLIH
jgi:hypothetical protein